jgi:Ca2+-binding RTX toxin-like protein
MKYTVMSYNADPDGGSSYPIGLQQFDIAALQEMYGVNYSTRSADTVYTFTTLPGILTIWDGGGRDRIDTQGISDNVVIDLRPGNFSSIGGTKNVAMALVSHLASENQARPLIEDAQSGVGNDELIGNDAKNLLRGGGGANKLSGCNGDDILLSEGSGDALDGGKGNDALINLEQDGNTTYVFGKGYGHDGLYDDPFAATNIDLILKDVSASDIEITFYRYDQNNSKPPEEQKPEPDYAYRTGILKILSTGDTLTLPWIYREGGIKDFFSYAEDSITFDDGSVWNVSDIENYSILETVATEQEFMYIDPVIFAFASEEAATYIPFTDF